MSFFTLVMILVVLTLLVVTLRGTRIFRSAKPLDREEKYSDYNMVLEYYKQERDGFLDWLYTRTSSPEIPVQVKLRDWVNNGFYEEGIGYWSAAQQFTSYLIDGGYVRAFDTEGKELTAGRVLADRPDTFQLTPSEYQRRNRIR